MGLTWVVEILAWSLSGTDQAAPQAVIIVLNLLNIFQVTSITQFTAVRR